MRKAGHLLCHWTLTQAKGKGRQEDPPPDPEVLRWSRPLAGLRAPPLQPPSASAALSENLILSSRSCLHESGRGPDGRPSSGPHAPWQVPALHAGFPVSDPSLTCSLPSPAGGFTQFSGAPGAKGCSTLRPPRFIQSPEILSTCFLCPGDLGSNQQAQAAASMGLVL